MATNDFRFIKNRPPTSEELVSTGGDGLPCVYPAIISSVTWIDGVDVVKGYLTENEVAVGEELTFAYDRVGAGQWHFNTLTPHVQAGVKTFVRLYDPACAPEGVTAYLYKLTDLYMSLEGGELTWAREDEADGWILTEVRAGVPQLVHGTPMTTFIDTTSF